MLYPLTRMHALIIVILLVASHPPATLFQQLLLRMPLEPALLAAGALAAGGLLALHTLRTRGRRPAATSAPQTDAELAALSMDDLVGNLDHLACSSGTFTVRGLSVRWWRYENPSLAGLGMRPVVACHGGPAFTHNYILPLKLLADSGHPVIFYDQAGCGESSFVADPASEAPWLLTIAYYVEELHAVVAGLGLREYHVYGSSWGTVLAQEFALTHPTGLRGLVLDGALCDGQVYIKTQWRDRIASLPTHTQKLLKQLEDSQAYDTPAYRVLEPALTAHFTVRQVPQPQCWFDCFKTMNKKIYVAMQGASEFTLGGVLEHWSVTDRLHTVEVPTLCLAGEFDTMSLECHQLIVDNMPNARPVVVIPRAAHCKMLDEPQLCCQAIHDFLVTIDD